MRTREPKSRPTQKVKPFDALAARSRKKLNETQQNSRNAARSSIKTEASSSDIEIVSAKRNAPDSPEIIVSNETHKRRSIVNAQTTEPNDGANIVNINNASGALEAFSERNMSDDYHFLLSLQPFMAELSSIQKLRVRMEMQKLIFDAMCESN